MADPETAVELEFSLAVRDFFKILVRQMFRRLWFLVFVLICTAADLLVKANTYTQSLSAIDFFPLAFITFLYAWFFVGAPYWSARSIMKNQNFAAPLHFRFSETGIDVTASGSSGHNDWSIVHKVEETKHYILLFAPKQVMYLLPKTAIGTKMPALRQMLRTYVPKNVKLRS